MSGAGSKNITAPESMVDVSGLERGVLLRQIPSQINWRGEKMVGNIYFIPKQKLCKKWWLKEGSSLWSWSFLSTTRNSGSGSVLQRASSANWHDLPLRTLKVPLHRSPHTLQKVSATKSVSSCSRFLP